VTQYYGTSRPITPTDYYNADDTLKLGAMTEIAKKFKAIGITEETVDHHSAELFNFFVETIRPHCLPFFQKEADAMNKTEAFTYRYYIFRSLQSLPNPQGS